MQAEIVTIGTELLLGEIVDTNSAWIAQQLTTIGLNLYYTTTVGDNLTRITDVLTRALERADVVITTGGLGPTVDDMTREGVAAATGRDLYLDESLLEEIRAMFGQRGHQMTSNNDRQARLPRGAEIIHNPVGTAPCFAVEQGDRLIISLPGVPSEMRYLMEHEVLPLLKRRFGLAEVIKSRVVRTCGIGESAADALIPDLMVLTNPSVGTRAHPGQTDIVITAKANSEAEAAALIAPVEAQIRERLGFRVFGVDQDTIAGAVARDLATTGLSLALVELTTEGELAQQMADASRAHRGTFGGALVVSDQSALVRGLSLEEPLDDAFPSQSWADSAASAARARFGADLALAILGPLNPGSPDAGEAYLALATPDGIRAGEARRTREGTIGRWSLIYAGMDLVRAYLLAGNKQH
ncbi:MAG: CinA family nicotinamide mononucleotide deamidase-related protein [Chloroflexi bacterium]|nr:CinA family nicotinamide mononucleotide deamidase-related protein [Chloroflexota bacterium]